MVIVEAMTTLGGDGFVPFDPTRESSGRDFIMAMMDPGADVGTVDYFDRNVPENWAGPERRELRKVIRRCECTVQYLPLVC